MGRVSTHAALGFIASILSLAQPVVIAAVFLAVILASTDLFLFSLLALYMAVPAFGVLSLVLEFAALHGLGDVYQRKDLQKNAPRFVVLLLGGAAKWSWRGALLFIALVGALLILAARIYALKGYHALKKAADPNSPPP